MIDISQSAERKAALLVMFEDMKMAGRSDNHIIDAIDLFYIGFSSTIEDCLRMELEKSNSLAVRTHRELTTLRESLESPAVTQETEDALSGRG